MCHEKSWRTKCGVDGLDLGRQEDTTVVKQQGGLSLGSLRAGICAKCLTLCMTILSVTTIFYPIISEETVLQAKPQSH